MKTQFWIPLLLCCLLLTACATSSLDTSEAESGNNTNESADSSVQPTLSAFDIALTEQAKATPRPTVTPPPTSCNEVSGVCLQYVFDGERCIYEGPTSFNAKEQIIVLFENKSDIDIQFHIIKHIGTQTIQDMADYWGEREPVFRAPPSWSRDAYSVDQMPGDSSHWTNSLDAGIYTMRCHNERDGGWFGDGFIVEN